MILSYHAMHACQWSGTHEYLGRGISIVALINAFVQCLIMGDYQRLINLNLLNYLPTSLSSKLTLAHLFFLFFSFLLFFFPTKYQDLFLLGLFNLIPL